MQTRVVFLNSLWNTVFYFYESILSKVNILIFFCDKYKIEKVRLGSSLSIFPDSRNINELIGIIY